MCTLTFVSPPFASPLLGADAFGPIPPQFVYPHTIESHALSVLPAALQQLQQSHSQRLHLLTSLAESKERARKARLNQIAPGWAEGGVMEPVRKEVGAGTGARGARSAKPKTDLLEDEEDQVPTPKPKKDVTPEDLFDMGQVESPVEAGDQTLDEARRNQMSDFVDGLFALDSSLGGKKDEEGELI